jgi:predicted O-methyltransferase YrrM
MIFIGDLSKQDAELLAHMGSQCKSILEFGVGGSTQILAQSLQDDAALISLDTDVEWINRTTDALQALGIEGETGKVLLGKYEGWAENHSRSFDLIFVDGVDGLRHEFAVEAWPRLLTGGVMLFHDTRRLVDMKNVLQTALCFYDEVDEIVFNVNDSNITAIIKGGPLEYRDWNQVEGKEPWMFGAAHPPKDWVLRMAQREAASE